MNECKSHIFNKMLACICTNSTTSYFFERRIVVKKMRKDQAKLVFYKDLRSLLFFLSFISNLRFEERRSLEFNLKKVQSHLALLSCSGQ